MVVLSPDITKLLRQTETTVKTALGYKAPDLTDVEVWTDVLNCNQEVSIEDNKDDIGLFSAFCVTGIFEHEDKDSLLKIPCYLTINTGSFTDELDLITDVIKAVKDSVHEVLVTYEWWRSKVTENSIISVTSIEDNFSRLNMKLIKNNSGSIQFRFPYSNLHNIFVPKYQEIIGVTPY